MTLDNSERGRGFADLGYTARIAENYAAEQVAAALGFGYDAFYARIRNHVVFSADERRTPVSAASTIATRPKFARKSRFAERAFALLRLRVSRALPSRPPPA